MPYSIVPGSSKDPGVRRGALSYTDHEFYDIGSRLDILSEWASSNEILILAKSRNGWNTPYQPSVVSLKRKILIRDYF